ncbi:MAG: hypothetical protein AAFQ82_25455, partial [Myxococcota bacterium]
KNDRMPSIVYHFVFRFRTAGIPGNPVSLRGASLDEGFNPKSLDKEGGAPAWHKPAFSIHYAPEEALAFPEELWLNTGERALDFDFRPDMHGYIVSDRFVAACGTRLTDAFKVARLNIVNRKGRHIAARPMFFAKALVAVPVLEDAERDTFRAKVTANSLTVNSIQAHRLTLRTGLSGEIHFAKDIPECLLVSDALAVQLRDAGLKGLELTAPEDAVARFNDRLQIRDTDGNPVSAFG